MSSYHQIASQFGIKVNFFDVLDCGEGPGRVYASGSGGAWHVCFSPPKEEFPVMFLYVRDFDAALSLAQEIGAARKAGNVDAYVGRWTREKQVPGSNQR